MPSHARMIWAVFRRNFLAYFMNPTGYVFITVFILLGAMAAFWQVGFFMNNLANLDQLNAFFPILLLFFIPALTMNVWADERKQGTDELLFTLPGPDVDIVLGKYLAVLGIYTVAVFFSLSHVIILSYLGDPDWGLMIASYIGYWLAGAALLSVGMVASLLTGNTTVAFILGAGFCAALVFIHQVENIFGGRGSELIRNIGLGAHFRPFGDGVIPLSGVFYFLALTVVMLYVNVILVGRRHFGGGEGAAGRMTHLLVRAAALAVIGITLGVLCERWGAYADATAERLHTLQPQTIDLIDQIPEDRPVFIQAFFSKDIPESYVRTRKNLLNLLERFDDIGGDRIRVAVHETEPYTEAAAEAAENYGITPRPVMSVEASRRGTTEVILGLVFTSGPEEFVIPFFDRGLPVEYELARSVRVVNRTQRKKLGIVSTEAGVFGGFDFQTMRSSPDWAFVAELRKQYEVERVPPAVPYPDDLDAVLAVMPSTLTQEQMDPLADAILSGTPTLIFDDPFPAFNLSLAPMLPKEANRNPFMQQNQPPPEPKGNFDALLGQIGLSWGRSGIVWSGVNPHPGISDAPPEIVFVSPASENPQPFNPEAIVSSGLQEVVMLYPGAVRGDRDVPGANLTRTALLSTGATSGSTDFSQLVRRDIFGMSVNPNVRRYMSPQQYVLAMQVTGAIPADAPPENEEPGSQSTEAATRNINVIFVSDADIVSETFFNLRRQGMEGLNFDNVTFALNCIDVLAGDESFVSLRKHRPQHRTLSRVEDLNREFRDNQAAEREVAEAKAADQLQQAQQQLDQKVQAVRERTDLDEQAKAIMLRNLEQVENRRLDVVEMTIEQEKEQAIAKARTEMETAIAGVQRTIKWWAAILPPIPTLLLAVGFFAYRYQREKVGVSERQLVRAKS
ncbi:MAG: Gldg family protein [Phycisphaerales bacterium]|nr:MAG: Gldg family protein [Phycisphaerales bacterium]